MNVRLHRRFSDISIVHNLFTWHNRFCKRDMERWSVVRQRVERYLGERKTPKDRQYSTRRRSLAKDLGIEDVTLKGFLMTPQNLGWLKLGRLLAKQEFQDLRGNFPELDEFKTPSPEASREVQLELDFDGFEVAPECRLIRLPVSSESRWRLTIRKIS